MKSLVAAIAIALSAPAFASPADIVKQAFGTVVDVVKQGNEAKQITTICALVNEYVDVASVGNAVLGKGMKSGEKKAISDFQELVPSIIVSDLMLVASYFEYGIQVDSKLVPRAGGAKGVRMNIEISKPNDNYLKFIVVVNRSLKITNLEIVSYNKNMVDMKKTEFKEIMDENSATPVGHLVNVLRKDRDLIHCR